MHVHNIKQNSKNSFLPYDLLHSEHFSCTYFFLWSDYTSGQDPWWPISATCFGMLPWIPEMKHSLMLVLRLLTLCHYSGKQLFQCLCVICLSKPTHQSMTDRQLDRQPENWSLRGSWFVQMTLKYQNWKIISNNNLVALSFYNPAENIKFENILWSAFKANINKC